MNEVVSHINHSLIASGAKEIQSLDLLADVLGKAEDWRLLTIEEIETVGAGINSRYPNRTVLPFARRDDCDDVACFLISSKEQRNEQVLIIHDFASPGWEVEASFGDLQSWLKQI